MYLSIFNPMKKSDPHVLTFAPLRVVLKACDHLATPAGFCSTPETCVFNNVYFKNLRQKKL